MTYTPPFVVGDLLDWQYVPKTALEEVTSSTTLQNDDHLLFAIGATETWLFEMVIYAYSPNTDTQDLKLAVVGPTSSAGRVGGIGPATTISGSSVGDAQFDQASIAGATADPMVYGLVAASAVQIRLTGRIVGGGTAGNCQLQWAQNTSDASATQVLANSYLIATRVA